MATSDYYSMEGMGDTADEIQTTEDIEYEVKRMENTAPNLSALVGDAVAAKLTKGAGSLAALGKMPATNVQLLGYFDKTSETLRRVLYLESTELVSSTPPESRSRCLWLLAAKVSLAAKVDFLGQDPTGNTGKRLHDKIATKFFLSC